MPNRRKTTARKELEGTFRSDRGSKNFLLLPPIPKDYRVPAYFGEIATAEWIKVIEEYEALGIFSLLDTPMLSMYCKAVEDLHNIEIDIFNGDEEIVTTTSSLNLVLHPIFSVKTKLCEIIIKCSEKLGLNPMSRDRLPTKNPEKDMPSEFKQLFG